MSFFFSSSRCLSVSLTLFCFLLFGIECHSIVFADEDLPEAVQPYLIQPPFAWNNSDSYVAPDYEGFFPDDKAGGEQLDLMLQGKLKPKNLDHRLAILRRGLRNSSRHTTTTLGDLGKSFVWTKSRPEPRAMEILYHASASPDRNISHYALYHGPTVSSFKTPNLVRMMMEQHRVHGREIQNRMAWGMKEHGDREQNQAVLLELLDQFQQLDESTVSAALSTYQKAFDAEPPNLERFDDIGLWVIAYHRTDLSATHPHAKQILRTMLDKPLYNREKSILGFVTRVNEGYETAVVLVRGNASRRFINKKFSNFVHVRIDFEDLFSARVLQERRLREFASHLSEGLPPNAKPDYSRPPLNVSYAFQAEEFIPPDFEKYFADNAEEGKKLDKLYQNQENLNISDRELLTLFRQGLRNSSFSPNTMFGWLSGALGWPQDPRLTEIFYQATDPTAPADIRKSAIYYGFGLSRPKTKNMIKAMAQVYMAPPFDRTTTQNMRSRILWGVRDHEDDKYLLASHFEQALQNHAQLSDQKLELISKAYIQLTGQKPPNAAEYANRGLYLVMFVDKRASTIEQSKPRISKLIGNSPLLLDTTFTEENTSVMVWALVRGTGGLDWIKENLESNTEFSLHYAELFTAELAQKVEHLKVFEKHLREQQPEAK